MQPAEIDLTDEFEIYRGDDYSLPLYFYDDDGLTLLDLTGYSAPKSQIRAQANATPVIHEFTCTIAADQVANRGLVTLTIARADAEQLPPGTWVWDYEMIDPDDLKATWAAGAVDIVADVSRA